MMLADAAQSVGGKLYILGGGWSITGPGPSNIAIAIKVEVPWDQTNQRHTWKLDLADEDGQLCQLPSDDGTRPLVLTGDFEVGRPPGVPPGSPIDWSFAINLNGLPVPPGGRWVFRLWINEDTDLSWQCAFTTRPAAG